MTDGRSTPDPALVDGHQPAQIAWHHVDLLRQPNGARERQLLAGAAVTVLGALEGHSYIQADHDGYIGFVPTASLMARSAATHVVSTPGAHVYAEASIKSSETGALSFGATLTALADTADFIQTHLGHVPKAQLATLPTKARNPIDTARVFLGTPYLWGGNTRAGIDCSGLVQAALLHAGHPCPGDSDQQESMLGTPVDDGAYQPGDLLFWKGHVALVTSATHMIHANAFHMSTVEEPIVPALARIETGGGGTLTSHKRL